MKHTKGEWRACCLDAKPHYIFAGEDKTICSMFCNEKSEPNYESMEGIVTKEECVANAKLIATAPKLLKTLQKAVNYTHHPLCKNYHGWLNEAIEIIKKATE
jgi:hypothetical protein